MVLLKLHYLALEVHEIQRIFRHLNNHPTWSKAQVIQALGPLYERYRALKDEEMVRELRRNQVDYLTIYDSHYPEALRTLYRPPLVLFYQGDIQLLKERKMAVVGSRTPTHYGEQACIYFVRELVRKGVCIVSGLARGIDGLAHREAIRSGGKTIAVLGSGILNIYPKAHQELAGTIAEKHLLISEYPPFEPPRKTHFPFRNRIVSGLSEGVLVIEAAKRSGTLITCDFALEQGKDVYAVPGSIFSEKSRGTNELIQQGAKLVQTIEDILV